MHSEAIDEKTKRIFTKISKCDFIQNFYLAGGTALAIQLGHRESIDLDFFSNKKFKVADLKKRLSEIGNYSLDSEDERTLNGSLDNVKLSFFYYGYDQLCSFVDFEGVKLADERDIAAMKVDAISSRGTKKDFIDLYFLLKKYHPLDLIGFFEKKFSNIKYNRIHILKSLTFFKDAENTPMPIMLNDVDWETVKRKIISEFKKML